MFWMRNKENNFPIHTLIWRPVITFANILGPDQALQNVDPDLNLMLFLKEFFEKRLKRKKTRQNSMQN